MIELARVLFYFLVCIIITLGLYSTASLIGIAIGIISAFMDSRQK